MTLTAEQPAVVFDRRAYRPTSIDMLRGLVIVIMAVDHVRDYVSISHSRKIDRKRRRRSCHRRVSL
jgi:uncharacterized membrane protein